MKFNPLTNELYTDDLRFIKKLHCPYQLSASQLQDTLDATHKLCHICHDSVYDTKIITEDALLALVKTNPSVCLQVDFNQDNLKII